ncbi:MAG: ABC transporter permease [Myxococcota bacterium]
MPNTRALLAAWRVGFTHVFAYRTDIAIQLVSASIVAGLNGSLWTVAIRGRDRVAGVPADDMLAYVVVAWVTVTFVATRVNEEIGRRFRDGQIASDLLRPASLQAFWYARDLGRACAGFLVLTLPVLGVAAIAFGPRLPASPAPWAAWLVSLWLAHATNYGLSFLVGLAALRLENVAGLSHLKGTAVSLFSGALIPLELFGPAARAVVFALPFHAMAHTPAVLLLGRAGDPFVALGTQAAWAAGLWAAGALAWRAASIRLTVQGG